MINRIELLAPAGTFESLVAAVQNGADAVYIGGSQFGARAFAGNFSNEELIRAVEYAHIRDAKIYVAVNTLIEDKDFDECIAFIDFLYRHDVDAVILQDVGLASYVHRHYPDLEIHASTQMSIANSEDALFYKSLGFSRIVVARENTAEEIRRMQEKTGLEIEAFVHGALCVSYSGKCLFSFANGGRSSNQGACAQPCRKKYHFDNGISLPASHFLSTKDLCTIKDLKQIIENGVYSLKIEGRMKRPEYVATVVRSYRQAIDALMNNKEIDLARLEQDMASIFNREFTRGLILGDLPKNLVNNKTPNNIGVPIGKITKIDSKNKKLDILLEQEVSKGDGLSLGEHIGRIFVGKNQVEKAYKNQTITIDFIGRAKVGDVVRKTSDKNLLQIASDSIRAENIKTALFAKVSVRRDDFPRIEVWDNRNNHILYVEESEKAQDALTKSLSEEEIIAQLNKTESEPYRFVNFDIQMDDGIFLKKSTLNSLRRNALLLINEKRKKLYIRNISEERNINAFSDLDSKSETIDIKNKNGISNRRKAENNQLQHFPTKNLRAEMFHIRCRNREQIRACQEMGIQLVYTDSIELYLYAEELSLDAFYMTPIMLKDSQIDELMHIIEKYRPNLLTTSLGFAKKVADFYKAHSIGRKIHLDYYFNAYNSYTFAQIESLGFIDTATISLEHPFMQKYSEDVIPNWVEYPLYIHPALMVTEYCPYKKKTMCPSCQVDGAKLLSDDGNVKITIARDMFCRMQLMGEQALDFSSTLSRAKDYALTKYRIDLLHEDKKQTKQLIAGYLGK